MTEETKGINTGIVPTFGITWRESDTQGIGASGHVHKWEPLVAAVSELAWPDFVVLYHCVADDCDCFRMEYETGYEV